MTYVVRFQKSIRRGSAEFGRSMRATAGPPIELIHSVPSASTMPVTCPKSGCGPQTRDRIPAVGVERDNPDDRIRLRLQPRRQPPEQPCASAAGLSPAGPNAGSPS